MSPRRPAVRTLVAASAVVISTAAALPSCGGGGPSVHAPTLRGRPAAYRIVYRVERPAVTAGQVAFEEVTVQRPFASRVAQFNQDPATAATAATAAAPAVPAAPESATVTVVDETFTLKPDGLHDVSGREA